MRIYNLKKLIIFFNINNVSLKTDGIYLIKDSQ